MDTFPLDVRYGFRMLARNPGFTAVAVLTLAVGIGATTTIFSFANAVILRPLPYPDSERLVRVSAIHRSEVFAVTPGDFVDWQAQNRAFEAMTAFTGATFSLTESGEPERVHGASVTQSFFRTMGVTPILGRTFAENDSNVYTAVLSERLWRRHFAADRSIVGRAITLDGKPFTVAAVMPASFTFPADSLGGPTAGLFPVDIWTPLTPEPGYRRNGMLVVVARLKRGTSTAQAQKEMTALASRIAEQVRPAIPVGVRVESLRDTVVARVRPLLYVFLGAVGLVLLIACVNVANLLLARATAREREVAVRSALGAGRWRLARQFMTESVLLGLLGGVAGLTVAAWGVNLARTVVPAGALPRLTEAGFDWQAMAFAIVASLSSALLFGLAPAIRSCTRSVVTSLKQTAGTHTSRSPLLDVLVISEVTLTFVLLAAAGLMVRSLMKLTSVDPGFVAERTLTLSVTLPDGTYEDSTQMRRFIGSVVERLQGVPGVLHAGGINWLPLGNAMLRGDFIVEGQSESKVVAAKPAVTPDYFRAMGIPLVRGRAFSQTDTTEAPGVAIVTTKLARQLWPGQDAIGKRLKLGFGEPEEQPWLSVVGIVGDVRATDLAEEALAAVYVPVDQAPRPFLLRLMTFVLRTGADAVSVAAAARDQVRRIDPALPIDRVATMENLLASSVSEPRFRSAVLTAFAGSALALVATGILGVLAYSVSRRTREIGVRVALGSPRAGILAIVVRHALVMTLSGIAIGLVASVALTRVLQRFLFETRPTDPLTLTFAAVLLVAVALVAVYVPARRALRIDPIAALRAE